MGSFKEHGVLIYLSKELYNGFIKLQADKSLGRSFAGLLPFTEGLFRLGYISKEVYEKHVHKYSKPLEDPIILTKERKKEKQNIEKMDAYFRNILVQWDEHPDPNWRKKVLIRAEKFSDKIKSAKLVLKKGRFS